LRGKNTSTVEIQNIARHGIWILVEDREFFIPFARNPWFKKARVDQIYDVECFRGKYLHWPKLDVDIEIDALEHPERYPLTCREGEE
jgi:hypothetical protein